VARLEDGPQDALGRDRIVADELPISRLHAAEILRPRGVDGAVEDHVTDISGAQVLRRGRKGKECVDLAAREEFERVN